MPGGFYVGDSLDICVYQTRADQTNQFVHSSGTRLHTPVNIEMIPCENSALLQTTLLLKDYVSNCLND